MHCARLRTQEEHGSCLSHFTFLLAQGTHAFRCVLEVCDGDGAIGSAFDIAKGGTWDDHRHVQYGPGKFDAKEEE